MRRRVIHRQAGGERAGAGGVRQQTLIIIQSCQTALALGSGGPFYGVGRGAARASPRPNLFVTLIINQRIVHTHDYLSPPAPLAPPRTRDQSHIDAAWNSAARLLKILTAVNSRQPDTGLCVLLHHDNTFILSTLNRWEFLYITNLKVLYFQFRFGTA
ncbi:hypothetical protein EVAR_93734_1 [Eumeta japonica]|uniref:Uncharacterized protein n=1 Tax=Eumeta variegata TaxID=151549 RepID=A0A4C1U2Y2_EUMVA|nr:hypothetical protein EVAR_93734_1 [Eumeta japonica]